MNSRGDKSPRVLQSSNYSFKITKKQFKEFISLREIEGLCSKWLQDIERYLNDYLDSINWIVDKEKTITYLKEDRKRFSVSTYRKKTYQIKKFLNYCGYLWANQVKLPKEPELKIKYLTNDDINKSINILKNHSQSERNTALILLGATSGLRAEEIYQLELKDIDIKHRVIYVNHDPSNEKQLKLKRAGYQFLIEKLKTL